MKKLVLAIVALTLSIGAFADNTYPTRPIELVVAFGAGGSDTLSRSLAKAMERELKQPVVVINKAGAGGSIGTKLVADAAPDGYTIGWAAVSNMMVAPMCVPNAGYDPVASFETVSVFGYVPNFLAVNEKFPANNYTEFVREIKANPGKYNIGVQPCGIFHMMFERFKLHTNLDIAMIPYKTGGQATMDALSGQVQMVIDSIGPMGQHMEAGGRLKPIAVAADQRVSRFPNTPTFKELGMEDAGIVSWYGLVVPAGTPAHIVKKLNRAVLVAVKDPEVQEVFKNNDAKLKASSPEDFSRFIKRELVKYNQLKERVKF